MKYLLPYRFKKIGVFIAPIGFILWFCMQRGFITKLFIFLFGESNNQSNFPYHIANVCIAIISFFSFLAGMYFISFSKEKVEDEMIQKTRLDSFQFAALMQFFFIIISFLFMVLYREPTNAGLMLFFISTLFIFWLCFIGRFNYILHFKIIRLSRS